jgi:hypothetical protein
MRRKIAQMALEAVAIFLHEADASCPPKASPAQE